jgi:hypothetical protein
MLARDPEECAGFSDEIMRKIKNLERACDCFQSHRAQVAAAPAEHERRGLYIVTMVPKRGLTERLSQALHFNGFHPLRLGRCVPVACTRSKAAIRGAASGTRQELKA